jgi:hypothetical protein
MFDVKFHFYSKNVETPIESSIRIAFHEVNLRFKKQN